jgi:hypothetical protein
MRDCQAIQSMKDIYWDIRPRPDFGTIELRVCDMPATLQSTLALVALVRSLAIASNRLLEEHPRMQRGDIRRHWIAVENKWLATRYGMEATYIRTPAGKRRPLKQDLGELLERLLPIARESGDDVFLSTLLPLDQFESGANRQRRLYRESGDPRLLVDDLVASLAAELDDPQGSAPSSSSPSAGEAPGKLGPSNQTGDPSGNGIRTDSTPQTASNQPAATPRASTPPTAGQTNPSSAIELPGSLLLRPQSANGPRVPFALKG